MLTAALGGIADDTADSVAKPRFVGQAALHEQGQHFVGLQGKVFTCLGLAGLVEQTAGGERTFEHVQVVRRCNGNALVATGDGIADEVCQAFDEENVILVKLHQMLIHVARRQG